MCMWEKKSYHFVQMVVMMEMDMVDNRCWLLIDKPLVMLSLMPMMMKTLLLARAGSMLEHVASIILCWLRMLITPSSPTPSAWHIDTENTTLPATKYCNHCHHHQAWLLSSLVSDLRTERKSVSYHTTLKSAHNYKKMETSSKTQFIWK